MKSRSSNSSKSNGFNGQFTNLNNNEMNSLRGGDNPPLPSTGGEDFPIDLLNMSMSSTSYSVQKLPEVKIKTLK